MKSVLEALHRQYTAERILDSDPLGIVHDRMPAAAEQVELTAFLAAMFAYGRVASIRNFITSLLDQSEDPIQWIAECGQSEVRQIAVPGPYRFQSRSDVQWILHSVGKLYHSHTKKWTAANPGISSRSDTLPIEAQFGDPSLPIADRIAHLQAALWRGIPRPARSPGIKHWIGAMDSKGARKRICMFLRWMVRTEHPDLGLYKSFDAASLVIPLDVHMGRMARNLGLTGRKTLDWTTAVEVSRKIASISGGDPARYDFALTRPGILGACKAKFVASICGQCRLQPICIHGRQR